MLKKIPQELTIDYLGFQRDTLELRDLDKHRNAASEASKAESNAARDKIQSKVGV